MRSVIIGLTLVVVGCNVLPAFVTQPTNMAIIPGGIADTRPYFGTFNNAGSPNSSSVSLGTFMLASCGCGDWRVLLKPDDGSPQRQFVVNFYSEGVYQSAGAVTVYGEDEGAAVSADLDQTTGLVIGHQQSDSIQQEFAGMRSAQHTQEVEACGLCHLGDDPIWPLPPQHPKKYLTNPRVCFECHTVNGQ